MNNYNLVFLRIFVSSCQLFKTTFVRSLKLHVFITVEDGVFLLLLYIMIICNVSMHMTTCILWKRLQQRKEKRLQSSQRFGWSPKVVACLGDVPTQWLLKSDRLQPQMPSHYHLMQQLLPGNAIENTSQRRQICHQPLFWREHSAK